MYKSRVQSHKESGFTIVELLIVIVVIGVLAAITIVAYNGFKDRADEAAVKSDLQTVGKKILLFYAEKQYYPRNLADLESLEWKATFVSYQQNNNGNMLYCAITEGANPRFVIAGRTRNDKAFTYSSNGGLVNYTGAWTGAWGTDCPIHGIPSSGEANMVQSQGFHPPTWGTPGWKKWTGGTI